MNPSCTADKEACLSSTGGGSMWNSLLSKSPRKLLHNQDKGNSRKIKNSNQTHVFPMF